VRKQLDTYNAKRDFSKTLEPSGTANGTRAKRSTNSRLRFVVQKHAARYLHYDFRLELDGVLRSWAVTRGPSLDPTDKRLAVEVEDHPLAYGDFEGTIPTGQYGGGTVQLWDRGYWQPQSDVSPQRCLKRGELKFDLFGERLTGSWVLVRMKNSRDPRDTKSNKSRNSNSRHNWLLIKHRDTASPASVSASERKHQRKVAEELLQQDASIASGRTMAQIAAGQGPAPTPFIETRMTRMKPKQDSIQHAKTATRQRQDVVQHRINGPKPVKRLPAFVTPELCKLMSRPPTGADWLHEIKLDGYRLQLRVDNGKVTLKTRKGLDWTHKFSHIASLAKTLPTCVIDGEMTALDAAGKTDFSKLQAALAENKLNQLVFFAFDLMFLEQRDLRNVPLLGRKRQLQALLAEHASHHQLRYVDHVIGDSDAIWHSACGMHLEGIVSKRSDSPYSSGRGGDWVKTKCRAGHEVVIGGMTRTDGQLRSLLVGVMRNRRLVYVGRVGTGFGASVHRQVMPQLKAVISKENPFHGATAPHKEANVTWLKPTLVAEIEFAGWTGGGMVRQAAFKGLRQDKSASEIQTEAPEDPVSKELLVSKKHGTEKKLKSATTSRKTTRKRHDVMPTHLSNADKILWPAAAKQHALTKLDLAEYYQHVSEWLLPHIQGRPCSILRAPNGITGMQFLQRHAMVGAPRDVQTIKVAGDRKPYLMIDTPAALAAIAQLGAMELHPTNCMPGNPQWPGRLVFDLDPAPTVDFKAVIKAALELRQRLEHLGMISFCKTTGGKGLHVVVPLAIPKASKSHDELDWHSAKLFTQTLCAQMAEDSPQQYLITMSKAARRGRIFLDYLRNDKLATAVAPLSPRARPGATVSMPLQWQQVRMGLDPQRFTIDTVESLLKTSQPWKDYARSGSSLAAAMKALLKNHRHAA